jgi:predicted TIM-barrel fold metal-dependent hydrolase
VSRRGGIIIVLVIGGGSSMIIDVDTHWESTGYGTGDHPLEPWRDQLPSQLDMLAFGIAGDLLRSLPAEDRPSAKELLPGLVRMAKERGGPIILHPQHDSTAGERVAWMDRVGIDHCLVNPGGYWQQLEFIGDDRPAGARRCNDFLAEQLADSDRLHPVAIVDFRDVEAAVAELERTRALGARAFFLYTEKGRPAGGRSPAHPDFDRVWAAATRLGMVAVIHVGNTSSDFDGWADIGWKEPGGAGVLGLTRLANTQRIHAAQNLLSALLYGGVFARHPTLTVLLEEMRVGWVPFFIGMLERQAMPSPALGDWPWDVSGGDMLRRAVRLTPLPGFGDVDALDVLAALPDMCVFSSDYPHQEGNAAPIELYGPALDELDEPLRDAFMGATMVESYARMGDPLAA